MRRLFLFYSFVIISLFLWMATDGLQAQGTGVIQGHVFDREGQPIPNVTVSAEISQLFFGWTFVTSTQTNATGAYTLTALENGTYHLRFVNDSYPHLYQSEYYNDAFSYSDATDIHISNSSVITGIDVQLTDGAHIKGTVTGPDGEPLSDIRVWFGEENYFIDSVTTNVSGTYDIGNLTAGEYFLLFDDTGYSDIYVAEYYDNVPLGETKTILTLTTDQIVEGIDAQLRRYGLITGTVTALDDTYLHFVDVRAEYLHMDEDATYWDEYSSSSIDENGNYQLYVRPGEYRIRAGGIDNYYYSYPLYPLHYASAYSGNTILPTLAMTIAIDYGETVPNIDMQLEKIGMITGVVQNANGDPLSRIKVVAKRYFYDGYADFWRWVDIRSAQTDEQGQYTLCCLDTGDYRISFEDYNGLYASEYYSGVFDFDDATLVAVEPNRVITGINTQLVAPGSIVGHVINAAMNPVNQVGIYLYRLVGGQWERTDQRASTDTNGYYQFENVPPGIYTLEFYDSAEILSLPPHSHSSYPVRRFATEYYQDQDSLTAATAISITTGMTTTADTQLDKSAKLIGTVTNARGEPLSSVEVVVYAYRDSTFLDKGWYPIASDVTDAQGHYRVNYLRGGPHRVHFDYLPDNELFAQPLYLSEYYDDQQTSETATTIQVMTGTTVSNINAELADANCCISGKVTDNEGNQLESVKVILLRPSETDPTGWEQFTADYTDSQGLYELISYVAETYRLAVQNNGYQTAYYGGPTGTTYYLDAAATFTVPANTSLTGLDIQLMPDNFNVPPLAKNNIFAVQEGLSASTAAGTVTNLLENDQDAESATTALMAAVVTPPAHGTLILDTTGAVTYTHDGSETTADHFTYRASDGISVSNVATVTITITPVNDAPIAMDDTIQVAQGGRATSLVDGTTTLLANDLDPDSAVLTATAVSEPAHGSLALSANGNFIYTHDGSATVTDSFQYQVADEANATDIGTVTITISGAPSVSVDYEFSKTVSIEGIKPECSAIDEMQVPIETTIVYCYTVRNTGDVTLTTHSLIDSHLGQLLVDVTYGLAPGATYSTAFTQTLTVSTTNIATWTATIDTGDTTLRGLRVPMATLNRKAATVIISDATADQDGDSIPDNMERAGDIDGDNLPNFLDTDADGDGVSDRQEVGDNVANPIDSDKDGIPDYLDRDSQPSTVEMLYLPLINR